MAIDYSVQADICPGPHLQTSSESSAREYAEFIRAEARAGERGISRLTFDVCWYCDTCQGAGRRPHARKRMAFVTCRDCKGAAQRLVWRVTESLTGA